MNKYTMHTVYPEFVGELASFNPPPPDIRNEFRLRRWEAKLALDMSVPKQRWYRRWPDRSEQVHVNIFPLRRGRKQNG